MRSKTLRIDSPSALLLPALLGLALMAGCGGGGAPSAEVRQQNFEGELAEDTGPVEEAVGPIRDAAVSTE